MEDTKLFNEKLFVYQHRIDAPHNCGEEIVKHCKEHPECKYYLFGKEKKNDGSDHYQGILFLTRKMVTNKEHMSWRNVKTRKWVYQHRNAVSFTKAKNVKSLAKYCNNKEGHGVITNLTATQLTKIGEWENDIKAQQKNDREQRDQRLRELMKDKVHQYYSYVEAYQDLAECAYVAYERLPPMRSLVQICKGVLPKQVFLQCLFRDLQR